MHSLPLHYHNHQYTLFPLFQELGDSEVGEKNKIRKQNEEWNTDINFEFSDTVLHITF